MWHESLVGHRVTEVLKIFDYIQVIFDGQKSLNVYGPCKVSGRDAYDSEFNKLLRSLIGRNVGRVELRPDTLTVAFSDGQTLMVASDNELEAYEFFSSSTAPNKSLREGFRPSMELTDAFNASAVILKRLETAADKTVKAMDFTTKEHGGSGDVKDGNPYYEWRWVLSKKTMHGAETFQRTLTVSFTQKVPSSSEAPVVFSWKAEIFRKAQPSWYSKSGQASRRFEDVEREGFEKVLQEASAQAEAALQGKKLTEG
jgi:hypothetical protein